MGVQNYSNYSIVPNENHKLWIKNKTIHSINIRIKEISPVKKWCYFGWISNQNCNVKPVNIKIKLYVEKNIWINLGISSKRHKIFILDIKIK
jgi:hypothetical protein